MTVFLISGEGGFLGRYVGQELRRKVPAGAVIRVERNAPIPAPRHPAILIIASGYSPKSNSEWDEAQAGKAFSQASRLLGSNRPDLEKVIFVSSTDVELLQDLKAMDKSSRYAHHKREMENHVTSLCAKSKTELTIVRVGPLYGPGEQDFERLIPAKIKASLRNLDFRFSGPEDFARPYVFVRDAASVLAQIAVNGPFRPMLHLRSRNTLDWPNISRTIERAVSRRLQNLEREAARVEVTFELLDQEIVLTKSTSFDNGVAEEVASYFE